MPGGGTADKFRIKIWDKALGDAAAPGALVYDNQPGDAGDTALTSAISGGSITIHKKQAAMADSVGFP